MCNPAAARGEPLAEPAAPPPGSPDESSTSSSSSSSRSNSPVSGSEHPVPVHASQADSCLHMPGVELQGPRLHNALVALDRCDAADILSRPCALFHVPPVFIRGQLHCALACINTCPDPLGVDAERAWKLWLLLPRMLCPTCAQGQVPNSFEGNGLPFLRLPRPQLTCRLPLPRPSPVRMRVQTVPFTSHTSASCQPRVGRCSPSPSPQGMTPLCNTSATRPDARLSLTNRLIPTSSLSNFPAQPCSLTRGAPDGVPRRAPAATRPKLSGSFWMTRPRSTPSARSPPASHAHSCQQPLRRPLVWGGSLPFAKLPEGFGALWWVIICAGWLPGLWLKPAGCQDFGSTLRPFVRCCHPAPPVCTCYPCWHRGPQPPARVRDGPHVDGPFG